MIIKSSAIDRLLQQNPNLGERRFGLPEVGGRYDGDSFNPTVQEIADAIEYYGFEVRDDDITTVPDIDLGSGNPTKYPPFPMAIDEMKKSLDSYMYKYPYTEGSDEIRKVLLDYIEKEGFINTTPYNYSDIDDKGLCVHNITFLPSTSIAFNMVVSLISKPGDVVLVTGPNYGLFTIRAERAGAEVEVLPLSKEDCWLVNPEKLANKIDEINESLQKVYNRRKGYIPRVVAFVNANPNNPTGKVMGEKNADLLKEIGEVCLKRGVFIIDDLVYRDLTFDPQNIAKPIATIPGMFRNTISLFGLSKSYGMASLRAGFVVADEVIIRELINRIFQGMDSAPDIVGRALAGAFNVRPERDSIYQDYFSKLRTIYQEKYQLLKALVEGIDSINNSSLKNRIRSKIENQITDSKLLKQVLKGLPYTKFPDNLEPESGFFAILDFTKVRGMKYNNTIINTERDLLTFFYRTYRTRFLVGQSISWPYPNELVGRVTFAIEDNLIISALSQMNQSLHLLEPGEDYIIRKNLEKDQEQMAHIKIDGWRTAYDKIVASKYLKSLDYDSQTQRYLSSFDEYKDLVFVAVRGDEVLGYSCFMKYDKSDKYDSELVSLYVKKEEAGRGIGSNLLIATAKELYSLGKKSMIVWCFSDNTNAIRFYEGLDGIKVEEKLVRIGEEDYLEYGFYFDLEKIALEN
ncbi:MAG: aminotransferase class I/II-fold pyridoxal phosphate-dependent enzyme [Tenericutes bacterium]|nr:aminotransferase class I/II-fold pyridoxal phosphate-dependent enzyme [Mycoplasmatota bacterium]